MSVTSRWRCIRTLAITSRLFVALLLLVLSNEAATSSSTVHTINTASVDYPTRTSSPQPSTPFTVVSPAWGYANGIWYIYGGYDKNFGTSCEGHTLNLTTPWNTARPPWVQAPTGLDTSASAGIFSVNGLYRFLNISGPTFTIFGNENPDQSLISLMILSSSTWLNATKIQVPVRTKGLLPVGNPQDGRIYIRGGYQSPLFNTMDVYDPLTDTILSHPLPEKLSTGVGARDAVIPVQWYSAQWCETRASILYFGGRPGNSIRYTTNSILEYKPTTNDWRVLSTTGPAPSEREDSCMTIDQENTKLVIFGGQDEDIVFGDIHVLDLITMEWTVGPLATEGRIAMACAQHEDGFLAWGGAKDKFLMARHNTQPVVFNLTTMQWTTQYKMSSALISPTPDTSTGKNTTVFAVALGVTMFVVALIAIVIGVCLYRREKRKAVRNYSKTNGKLGTPILKEGSRSMLPSDLAIPNPSHQRYRDRTTTGYGDGSRHDSEMKDYDEDISDQEDAGAHVSTDKKRRRRNRVSGIGHKIELSSMEPIARTSAVAGDKEEDLSFAAPSRIRPKVAPPIPHSQMPIFKRQNSAAMLQTQASAPPLPT